VTSDDGYRGYWYTEAQRLNSLAAHHAGNRAMQDVEIGQLRAQLEQTQEYLDVILAAVALAAQARATDDLGYCGRCSQRPAVETYDGEPICAPCAFEFAEDDKC